MKLLICVVLCLLSLAASQDDGEETTVSLTVGRYFNLPSDFDAYFGFRASDNDTNLYFANNLGPTLYWAALPQNVTSGPALPLEVQSVQISESNEVTAMTGFIDTYTNSAWIGSLDGIYNVNLTARSVRSIQISELGVVASFVDPATRTGYLVSALSRTLWRADLDNFNATFFTQSPLQIYPSERAAIYDSKTKIAYVGGDTGIERIDTSNPANITSLGITTYGTSSARASVLLKDDSRGRLYACFDESQESLSIVEFDIATMEVIATFDLGSGNVYPSDSCSSGLLDTTTGQLLMVINQTPSAIVLAWDLATYTLNGYTAFAADPRQANASSLTSLVVNTVRYPGKREFFVLGFNQLVQVQYSTTCPSDCSGHGSCYFGNCTCVEGYVGDDCGSIRCENDCSGNGLCSQGNCLCDANYTSTNCSIRQCPRNCNLHGDCSGAPDYICACTGGWSGFDCSTPPPPAPPPQCPEISSYASCVSHSYCGWCGDIVTGKCMTGDIVGPVAGACTSWNYEEPPEIGVVILASFILGVLGFMFILDAISAIRLDYKRGCDLREEYQTGLQRKPNHTEAATLWWRDQRAAKAWTTLEHLQFLSVFANLSLSYPTRYLYFSRFVYWTNFALPLPFMYDKTMHADRLTGYAKDVGLEATRRELMGIEQYSNSLGILPHDLFASNMFWFAIAFAAVVVVYGGLTLICIKKTHWRVVFSCRLVYMIFRLLSVAYLGLMLTCGYTFAQAVVDYKVIVPAAIVFVIVGLGYPIGVYFILQGKNKQLFDNEFKFKFACLYINFRPENSLFSLRIIGRKFFTGLLVGVMGLHLNNDPKYIAIIQAALLALFQILYFVELIRTHPYYDHFHEYLEYFLVVVNVATLALSLIHYNTPNEAAYLITALLQVLALVACFGTYIISWMQMHPNFTFKKAFASCCGGNKKEKPGNNVPMDNVSNADTSIGVNQE